MERRGGGGGGGSEGETDERLRGGGGGGGISGAASSCGGAASDCRPARGGGGGGGPESSSSASAAAAWDNLVDERGGGGGGSGSSGDDVDSGVGGVGETRAAAAGLSGAESRRRGGGVGPVRLASGALRGDMALRGGGVGGRVGSGDLVACESSEYTRRAVAVRGGGSGAAACMAAAIWPPGRRFGSVEMWPPVHVRLLLVSGEGVSRGSGVARLLREVGVVGVDCGDWCVADERGTVPSEGRPWTRCAGSKRSGVAGASDDRLDPARSNSARRSPSSDDGDRERRCAMARAALASNRLISAEVESRSTLRAAGSARGRCPAAWAVGRLRRS